MNTEFKTYLQSINKTQPIIDHIEKIYNECKILLGDEEIIDIFLCEDFNNEGLEKDTSLFLFTGKSILEAKDYILNERDLDYSHYLKKFVYYDIQYKECDLRNFTDESWIKIKAIFDYEVSLFLTAIGMNCKYLMNTFEKYIKPNLKD